MLIGSSDFLSWPVREQPFSCAPYFHAILIGANDKPISNKLRNFDPPLFEHTTVGAYHPNFWRFIDILKREQNLTQVNIAQARAGHPAEPQRRRYQDSNQRIKNIVQDYPNRNIMQYLRGLAHNISMWRTLLLMFSALYHPKTAFLKSHQMTKVCHNHALPLYLLVFCKICTRIYCDFVPVICVLFVTCKLCDL